MEFKVRYPRLAMLGDEEDVDDVILRSSKVMEESRAVVLESLKKRQEKVVAGCLEDDTLEECRKGKRKISADRSFQGITFQDLQTLNLKIAGQLAYIKTLESKISDLKQENEKLSEKNTQLKIQHREEIFFITQSYEEKLKAVPQPNISGLESRMNNLEQKLKTQESKAKVPEKQKNPLKLKQKPHSQITPKESSKKKLVKNQKSLLAASTTLIKHPKKPRSSSESRILHKIP